MRICKCFAFTTVLLICVSRFQYAFSACMRDAAVFFQSTYMRKIFGFNPHMRQFSRCIYATVQVFRVFLETILFHMCFPYIWGMPRFFSIHIYAENILMFPCIPGNYCCTYVLSIRDIFNSTEGLHLVFPRYQKKIYRDIEQFERAI